jgi:hypothetical protein
MNQRNKRCIAVACSAAIGLLSGIIWLNFYLILSCAFVIIVSMASRGPD